MDALRLRALYGVEEAAVLPFDAEGGGTEMGALLAYLFPEDAELQIGRASCRERVSSPG